MRDDRPPRFDRPVELAMRRIGFTRWWRLWPLGVIASVVAFAVSPRVLPQAREGTPPGAVIAGIGIVVGLVGSSLLAAGIHRLGAPRVTVLSAAAGAFCVGIAKFAFAPLGFYDANQGRSLNLPVEGFLGFAIIATGLAVLALYAAGLRVLYGVLLPRAGTRPSAATTIHAILGVLGLAGVFVLGAMVIGTPGEYVEFVFASIAAGGVAISLLFAISAFGLAFGSAAERARKASDVGLYTAVFGLSLAFLVVFHVLWIVYMLALAAIWPLKTVAPK